MREADMREADMREVDMREADMREADMRDRMYLSGEMTNAGKHDARSPSTI